MFAFISDLCPNRQVTREAQQIDQPVTGAAAGRAGSSGNDEAAGRDAAIANSYTAAEAKRLLAGESPVRIWREKRGLTQRALAAAAAIPAGYLSEIEGGKKPGSVAAYRVLAKALAVPMEDLVGDG